MTNRHSHGKIHHAIKFGKPSISIRAIYTMAMLNNQRVTNKMGGTEDMVSLKIAISMGTWLISNEWNADHVLRQPPKCGKSEPPTHGIWGTCSNFCEEIWWYDMIRSTKTCNKTWVLHKIRALSAWLLYHFPWHQCGIWVRRSVSPQLSNKVSLHMMLFRGGRKKFPKLGTSSRAGEQITLW